MPEDRASRDGLLYLKEEELRSVLRTGPISDVYCIEDTVFARGKFATVRRALHKATGIQYAAKYIKKRRRNVNMLPEIHHEISVLLKCSSNNRVVRLYEVYETNLDMVLILGLAAGGELQRIFDGDQCLGEIEARRAMRQILDGLCYLHERNIAHLDLKPQNILLMVEDSCDDIKLCDFGISRLLEPGTEVRTLSGTPDYVAPEVVSYEPISLATDIWSVGVLAYVLLSGYTPFGAETKEQTSLNISKGIVTFEAEDFGDVSSLALDFINCILVLNPKQRPSVQQLLQHPWINPPSHILPALSLMPNSDHAISVTPKSTPIIQRKSLTPASCPPELPQQSQNNASLRTVAFNGDNLNGSYTDATSPVHHHTEQSEITNGKIEQVNGNNSNDYSCDLENPSEFEEMRSRPLSEASSEEIEENFCLLSHIEKPITYTEFQADIVVNSEFEYVEGEIRKKEDDLQDKSDNNSINDLRNSFIAKLLLNSETPKETQVDKKEDYTNTFVVDGSSTEEEAEEPTAIFVNTYKIDKQLLFSFECDETQQGVSGSIEKHYRKFDPLEILSNDHKHDSKEEIEYSNETKEILINTYEVRKED